MATNTNLWGKLVSATQAGVSAALDTFQNPESAKQSPSFAARMSQVAYRFSWYMGTTFDPGQTFGKSLVEQYLLYTETRLVWNPVSPIVDFWAGIVYPGELTDDMDSAIPLDEKTDPVLKKAIDQVWEWGNWATNKSVLERYVAGIGYDLVVVQDNVESGEVYPEIVWPAHVKSIDVNKKGDVKAYTLEYSVTEVDAQSGNEQVYIYREVVDKEMYRTYRGTTTASMVPYDISGVTKDRVEWPNPYKARKDGEGFVPAVWRRFRNTGGTFSPSCMGSAYGELAAINSLESHMDDQVHKSIDPTTVFWSGGGLRRMLARKVKDAIMGKNTPDFTLSSITSNELAESARSRQAMRFFEGPQGGRIDIVSGTGNLEHSRLYLNDKKDAFKDKFPEFTMYPKLREMSQVTGPAAEILLGDTKGKVVEVRGDADRQTKKLAQMCVAIAGWRYSEGKGGWAKRTAAQEKFATYSLESYDQGKLEFKIAGRHFIPDAPLSERERWELLTLKSEGMGVSKKWLVTNEGGYTEEQLREMERMKAEETPIPAPSLQGIQAAVGQPGRNTQPLVPVDKGASVKQIITPGGE